ncbi:MAG TPA: HAMP domain-containing protein, partial [Candidatus Ozemobacteraceae bacterium]|nr:HAMP domain-containing protein [Candidatus Ozemobacteraceae bacterium]
LTGSGLASSKGRILLDLLTRFLTTSRLTPAEKSALDSRTSGIFGEHMPFEFLAYQRRGRATPGTFEGNRVFILWDYVKHRERVVGAYLVVIPWQVLHDVRPLHQAIAPDPARKKSPLVPFLIPSSAAPKHLRLSAPPGHEISPAQRDFFRSMTAHLSRDELVPLGQLVQMRGFLVYRDYLSISLPYEIWVLCPSHVFSKSAPNQLLIVVSILLVNIWFIISAHHLVTGRPLYLPLRAWFPAFIALIGAVPLWLFYEAGSMQIDTSEVRQIQERVDETSQKLSEVDAGNAAITGFFKNTCRQLLGDLAWYARILSDQSAPFKTAVDQAMQHFSQAGLPLEILLSFPLQGPEKGFTPQGPMPANDSSVRLFTAFMNHCLKVIEVPVPRKADQMSEWMALRAFTGHQGPKGMEMVFGGNNEASMYDSGGRKLLYFQDLLSVKGIPKAFLIFRGLAADGYQHRLQKILATLNSREEPFRNYVLGQAVPGGLEIDVAADQQRFWASTAGRNLEEFMQLAHLNKTRQMYQGHRSFFIVHPCRHADGFFIGAHIPLQDIRLNARANRTFLNCLTILILSFILIIGLVASRRLISPLSYFETALVKVAQGNVTIRLGLDRDDELGLMSRSFDNMIIGL